MTLLLSRACAHGTQIMGVCLTESHAAVVLGVAVGLLLGPRLADDEQEVDQS